MNPWVLAHLKLGHLYTKEEIDNMTFGEIVELFNQENNE